MQDRIAKTAAGDRQGCLAGPEVANRVEFLGDAEIGSSASEWAADASPDYINLAPNGADGFDALDSHYRILPSAMPSTLAVASTFVPSVLAMVFTFIPSVSVLPSPSVLPCVISIVVSDPPMRWPTVVRPPVPKTIRTQIPIIPVFKPLIMTHRIQIGLLHVVYNLIGYALIA
jgi:hypothetical protein